MSHPFFTVGHSNRTANEFIDLLRAARIGMVVDVRTLPRSRTYPQFDSENLARSLAEAQIGYELIVPLGGRRNNVEDVPAETNGAWRNRSFHNYADYALTEKFKAGFDRLLALGSEFRCAIMCSEAGGCSAGGCGHLAGERRLRGCAGAIFVGSLTLCAGFWFAAARARDRSRMG